MLSATFEAEARAAAARRDGDDGAARLLGDDVAARGWTLGALARAAADDARGAVGDS